MIERQEYMDKIYPFIDQDIIKVFIGVRRSGKSVLLELLERDLLMRGVSADRILKYNFESYKTMKIRDDISLYEDIGDKIGESGLKHYVFLDEIQEVLNWEKLINAIRVDFNVDIYVTGSNARLLSGELATYLSGRYVEIDVYPFSFKEFIDNVKALGLDWDERTSFNRYVHLGGMPFLGNLKMEENSSVQYLEDIYRSVLLKDVIERNKIRDVELLERIILYLVSNIGRTFSAKSVSDYLKSGNRKVSPETVYNYIKACEDACLLKRIVRHDLVGKRILKIQEKVFIVDHGIRQAIYGRNQEDIEQVLENIVLMELVRRGYRVTVGKYKDREVDFVAEKNKDRVYVQVSYLLATDKVVEREFSVLEKIGDNYPKYVLSMDDFDFSRNGIIHINIREFLLS